MGAIVTLWRDLKGGDWNDKRFDELYQQVQNLGEAAGRAGLARVSESAFALEVYLSTFGSDQTRPGVERLQEAEALLRALDTAAHSALRGQPASSALPKTPPSGDRPTAYCLLAGNDLVQGLDRALKASGWSTRFFRDASQLRGEMQRQVPAGLVLDAAFLSALAPLLQDLKKQRAAGKGSIPTVFASSSASLQLRLAAMRAGADAYYAPPVDTETIAKRLLQIVASRQQSIYRVLIVEDDPSQAKFAGTILRKAGMETQLVTEALEVIQAVERFKPDLVLMDVYMPQASGVELTRIIRQAPDLVTLPIVYLSGEQDPERQQSALSVGADDFIVKPIRPKHLINTVGNRIRRARQLQDGMNPTDTGVDPRTGLATKESFFDCVDALLGSRAPAELATIMHIDLDGSAELRSGLGAEDKEALMGMAGRRIANQLTESDAATRSGEAGFTLLLREARGRDLRLVANRLLQAISEPPIELKGRAIRLSPSAGFWPLQREASQDGTQNGPTGPARARQEPRPGAPGAADSTALQALIKEALEADRLRLVLQPVLGSSEKAHPKTYQVGLGLADEATGASPEAIRSTAEKMGVRLTLDALVLERSLQLLEQQQASGEEIQLLLTLSMEYMSDPRSLSSLKGELRARQLLGVGLIFVMPLRGIGSDPKNARIIARELADMGIASALSEFTGSDAAIRVLKFLDARYVEIDETLAHGGDRPLAIAIKTAHQSGALVILPSGSDSSDWQSRRGPEGPDFIIRQPAQPVEAALPRSTGSGQ